MHCEFCLQGRDNLCRSYSVLGYVTDGGYAELVKIPAVNALSYPAGLEYTEAAAIPLVFMTAWHMLVDRCRIKAGEEVLVLGAGSGVGSAAIQIAKFFRARVIATAGSDKKLSQARELGADLVINHSRQKIRDEVKQATGKRGVDIVFEHVGAATWEDSVSCLAHHGRLVTCGATTGYDVRLDLRHLFAKQIDSAGILHGFEIRVDGSLETGHGRSFSSCGLLGLSAEGRGASPATDGKPRTIRQDSANQLTIYD